MKNFKKLIKESYLGNPLDEVKITPVSGTKAGATYSLNSDRKLVLKKDVEGAKIGNAIVTLPKGTIIYNLPGGVLAAHESLKDLATSSNPYYEKDNYSGIRIIKSRDILAAIENAANLEESLEDRATRVDKMLSGEYEDEDYKDSKRYADVRADLEAEEEMNEDKLPDGFHSREDLDQFYNDVAMDEYGKPFAELSIAQKQELISYMNRETEKQFQTDYERRRRGDYSDDRDDGMTDYQRRRMDEGFNVGDKIVYRGGNPGEVVRVYDKDNEKSFLNPDEVEYKIRYKDLDSGNTNVARVSGKAIALEKDLDDMGRKYFGKDYDLEEDINDPALVKARAAQIKKDQRDREEAEYEAKQAALDKKYGSSFMDKLDAEISLKQELQDLKDEREQLMIDMEQEAEPEGGEIADLYGMKLNRIDLRTAEIKSELEDLRMYESVNESKYRVEYEDKDDNRHYIEIKASSEEEAEQKSSSLDGFRTIKSIELVNEEYSDLDLYYRKGYKDFTGLVNRIVGEKDLEEKRKLMHVYINILPKASREKKFKLKQSINKMGPSQIDKFAYNILMRDSRMTSLEEDDELNVNVSNDNDIADKQEANSGVVGESKGFNFKQMVKESLIPKNLK